MTESAHPPPERWPDALDAMDASALEVLAECNFDLARVPAPFKARAARVAALLGVLDSPAPVPDARDSGSLVDATLARVMKADRLADSAPRTGTREDALVPDDEDALDSFVTEGYREERVPASLRPRAARLSAVGALLTRTHTPVYSADLAERTMTGVPIRHRPVETQRFRLNAGGFRLTDLVSVAAVLLIGASVVWPMLATLRGHQQRLACGTNMSSVATAMGLYTGDFQGHLPVASAGFGGSWWDVGGGPGRSNSANLFRLPKLGYASLGDLACPGNAKALCATSCKPEADDWGCINEISYSYQVMSGPRPEWRGDRPTVILADGSPVTRKLREGKPWSMMQNSANHEGRGQWALLTDGSATWLISPIIADDNIWLPGSHDKAVQTANRVLDSMIKSGVQKARGYMAVPLLKGNEQAESKSDAFLGP